MKNEEDGPRGPEYTLSTQTGCITAVSLTNPASGYHGSMGAVGANGGGGGGYASSTVSMAGTMPSVYNVPSYSGSYTLSSSGYGYGSIATALSGAQIPDVTIQRPNGEIQIGKAIETILDHLQLIVPNQKELDANPSLKLAYENYLEVLKATRNADLKEAYDSYHMVRKLSRDDD